MRLYHYVIIFLLIAFSYILIHNYNYQERQAADQATAIIENAYNSAVDDAVRHLVSNEDNIYMVQKEEAIQAFLESFSASIGVLDNPIAVRKLESYIPCALVTAEDGFYLYYTDQFEDSKGNVTAIKRFTEKIPYAYEDDWFKYSFTLEDTVTLYDKENRLGSTDGVKLYQLSYHDVLTDDRFKPLQTQYPNCILLHEEEYELTKRATITDLIEEHMTYVINEYNKIAFNQGISYHFFMPVLDNSDWARSMESPSILVLFQGYPIHGTQNTFQMFTVAQAVVNRKNAYYVENKGWYSIYHKSDCTDFTPTDETVTYYSRRECAEHGCFACEVCFPNQY